MAPLGSEGRGLSRAELALGPQRPTGGNYAREEVMPSDYRRWRVGTLHRVDRTGRVLFSLRVEWDEWPRARRQWIYRQLGQPMRAMQPPREVVECGGSVNFTSGKDRYCLESEPA